MESQERSQPPVFASIDAAAQPDSGIIWQTGFETGDFSELNNGGHITISGLASAKINKEFVHSGQYSAALTIRMATGLVKPGPGARLAWQADRWVEQGNAKNLPDEAYYSAYYYFPEVVQTEWWDIMQWKQAYVTNDGQQSRNPIYFLSAVYQADGQMRLLLRSKVDEDGKFTEPGSTLATAPVSIPIAQWVHLECFYRWSQTPNGRITCWQDGQQIWDVNRIITEFNVEYQTYPRQWTVNNYAAQTEPSSPTIYVDDLAVSLRRLGAN